MSRGDAVAAIRRALAPLVFELERADALSAGACACGRERVRFLTERMRMLVDEVAAALAQLDDGALTPGTRD